MMLRVVVAAANGGQLSDKAGARIMQDVPRLRWVDDKVIAMVTSPGSVLPFGHAEVSQPKALSALSFDAFPRCQLPLFRPRRGEMHSAHFRQGGSRRETRGPDHLGLWLNDL